MFNLLPILRPRGISVPFCIALVLLILMVPAFAHGTQAEVEDDSMWKFAVGVEAGTAGLGPVVVVSANEYLSASVGYTWFNYSHDYDSDDITYDGKLKLSNLQALVNYHPFAGTFHISAGLFACNDKVELTGKAKDGTTFTIGGVDYSASEVGTLYGDGDIMDGVAPFVGIGWSKSPQGEGLGFTFDIGVLFIDSPSVSLTATGEATNYDEFWTNLHKEEADINDDLDSYKFYPIVQLGIIYRF